MITIQAGGGLSLIQCLPDLKMFRWSLFENKRKELERDKKHYLSATKPASERVVREKLNEF